LKKRTKKLFFFSLLCSSKAHSKIQKFFASFFQKRSAVFSATTGATNLGAIDHASGLGAEEIGDRSVWMLQRLSKMDCVVENAPDGLSIPLSGDLRDTCSEDDRQRAIHQRRWLGDAHRIFRR